MKYSSYQYLYPPRPTEATPEHSLKFFERRGWVGQVKKNGTCTLIFTDGEQVIFKTRHNDDHKMWTPSADIVEFFKNVAVRGKWSVFVAELLHSKTPNIKNTLYVFDIIVHDGEQLVGTTFGERQELLTGLFSDIEQQEEVDHFKLTPNIWLAKLITKDVREFWKAITAPEDEGVVMKNATATLLPCFKEGSNGAWQVKCRFPHKNYSF